MPHASQQRRWKPSSSANDGPPTARYDLQLLPSQVERTSLEHPCESFSFTNSHRIAISAAAARHRLPVIGLPDLVRAGGLLSYWYDSVELHAQAASYIDRILRGASPGDLPIQYATKYSLLINLKTAKALGLTVPPSMLDLADEVIE